MNMTVNMLPVRTWNRLGMNESRINIDTPMKQCIPKAGIAACGFVWNSQGGQYIAEQDMETGMGQEAAHFFADSGLSRLRALEGKGSGGTAFIEYSYEAGMHAANRIQLYAEQNSRMPVVIELNSPDGGEGVAALQILVHAQQNAKVQLYVVQLLGEGFHCLNDIGIICEENASVELVKLELGAEKNYSGVAVNLIGEESSFDAKIGYHVYKSQNLDMNYVIRHYGARTQSMMKADGILEQNAGKIFRGTIDFKKGAKEAKGTEQEDVLLMGDRMINQTIPLILCEEEDVEGNHGATIGQIDQNVLFYLETRGFSAEEAKQMITQARIDSLCERIPLEEVRRNIQTYETIRRRKFQPGGQNEGV